jgi:hypothetical protein
MNVLECVPSEYIRLVSVMTDNTYSRVKEILESERRSIPIYRNLRKAGVDVSAL